MRALTLLLTLLILPQPDVADWRNAPPEDWHNLFNGRGLDGWVVKLAHHELGDNYADTFRVENGAIRVMYDKYDAFGERFGHLFYDEKLSHYVLALEYRFFGEQMKGGPDYARLNSGVMIHSQAPKTILKDQDWPISVEAQFLAGGRTTMNVCTPGTEIFMDGAMVKEHCTDSTSKVYGDNEWVAVEVEVRGAELVRHMIGGQAVLSYERPTIGGGVAHGFDPAVRKDGTRLGEGYIGLQAESQPVEFRNIRLLNLAGCMDQTAPAYRPYFVHRDDSRCRAR
ncbi:MAG: 3-keto-disaccharide hydrolase [Vicinamibacteraceae bacterium]